MSKELIERLKSLEFQTHKSRDELYELAEHPMDVAGGNHTINKAADLLDEHLANSDTIVTALKQADKDIAELVGALDCAYKLLEPFDDPGLSLGLGSDALTPIKQALAKFSRGS